MRAAAVAVTSFASRLGRLRDNRLLTSSMVYLVANIVFALLCMLPLLQLAREAGRGCATSSLLIYSIPLLAGWIVYAALSYRTRLAERVLLAQPAGD